jgi:DNA repair protein RecN (Recombination protein N)
LFLRDYQAGLDASPERLQAVEDRLAAIERLKRRFGPDLGAVIARRADLAAEIAALDAGEELAARLEADEHAARDRFLAVARELSQARRRAARALGAALAEDLAALAMPRSQVDVRLDELAPDDWHRRGIDRVEFYISPNPGEDLRPLARIASGGELSRVMLALRTLGRVDQPGRTLVFDEVDAGIGGEAADAVGARLQALARDYQVICITHLPQIAAHAATHLAVAKHLHDSRTVTSVARLDASGREQELARMIAGAQVTAKVLASAQEMMRTRQAGEANTKGEGPAHARKAKAKGQRGA